ncbi:3-ketoacyl-ACP reductase [Sorangium cellulosum]|uniref:3-ketoacyl-ACP reductase n=1 Tax=Sorangium cellulosum TaxID=56 RepID=A0A2L0ES46_SORCE|nr:glucose 1-dehydrogenase [Sorangium cellulosum]AUX42123.1 3-ketoacyl-ACP reductase [Sorangium cellulosum]
MSGKLSGKVAIVTGGSRGIGAAIAKRLAGDGAAVALSYVNREEPAMGVVAEIRSAGGRATAVRADVAEPAQITALFERAVAEHGRLDILVNNAGVYSTRTLGEIDEAHFEMIFNVNVRSVVLATQEAARRFGDEGGRIINLSSIVARSPRPSGSVYSASKAAIEALTRCHAAELGRRGITVNAVAPGLVNTEMIAPIVDSAPVQARLKASALGRLGQPEEIADTVAFLASNDSRWLTGQVVEVSGGAL